jgi:hypothetical protein
VGAEYDKAIISYNAQNSQRGERRALRRILYALGDVPIEKVTSKIILDTAFPVGRQRKDDKSYELMVFTEMWTRKHMPWRTVAGDAPAAKSTPELETVLKGGHRDHLP